MVILYSKMLFVEFKKALLAVSYTHLDVYKRQDPDYPDQRGPDKRGFTVQE